MILDPESLPGPPVWPSGSATGGQVFAVSGHKNRCNGQSQSSGTCRGGGSDTSTPVPPHPESPASSSSEESPSDSDTGSSTDDSETETSTVDSNLGNTTGGSGITNQNAAYEKYIKWLLSLFGGKY
jgi:hypothetical protein